MEKYHNPRVVVGESIYFYLIGSSWLSDIVVGQYVNHLCYMFLHLDMSWTLHVYLPVTGVLNTLPVYFINFTGYYFVPLNIISTLSNNFDKL